MRDDIATFFSLHRHIFGICPHCEGLFRLSDIEVFLRKKPVTDWLDTIEAEAARLDKIQEKLEEKKEELQEKGRKPGRRKAQRIIKKIDPVFTPRKLNPDDAKVIFHPIDYVVFNGMKDDSPMRNIIFLDRKAGDKNHRKLQRSIERVVEKGQYEWVTMRVRDDGAIEES